MADSLFYRERKEQVINKNPLLKYTHNEVSSNSKVQYDYVWEKRNVNFAKKIKEPQEYLKEISLFKF